MFAIDDWMSSGLRQTIRDSGDPFAQRLSDDAIYAKSAALKDGFHQLPLELREKIRSHIPEQRRLEQQRTQFKPDERFFSRQDPGAEALMTETIKSLEQRAALTTLDLSAIQYWFSAHEKGRAQQLLNNLPQSVKDRITHILFYRNAPRDLSLQGFRPSLIQQLTCFQAQEGLFEPNHRGNDQLRIQFRLAMAASLEPMTHLRELDLTKLVSCSTEQLQLFFDAIPQNVKNNIKCINLSGCRFQGLRIEGFPGLSDLILIGVHRDFTPQDAMAFLQGLPQHQIKRLELGGWPLEGVNLNGFEQLLDLSLLCLQHPHRGQTQEQTQAALVTSTAHAQAAISSIPNPGNLKKFALEGVLAHTLDLSCLSRVVDLGISFALIPVTSQEASGLRDRLLNKDNMIRLSLVRWPHQSLRFESFGSLEKLELTFPRDDEGEPQMQGIMNSIPNKDRLMHVSGRHYRRPEDLSAFPCSANFLFD
ncbi:MAG: hypothetical protein V4623_09655 [Pseudomonadota bacterium]